MARPKTAEGKRVTICAKFSDDEASAVDTARGSMSRSEWLRLAALAAAERQRPPAGRIDRQAGAVRQNRDSAR